MKGLFRMAYCTNRYALLLPILFYGLYMLTDKLFFVKKSICSVDGGSILFQQTLQNYIKPLYGYTALSIVKSIVKQFPCIDDISVVRTVDQTLYCDVVIKPIAYCLNNESIITTDNNLYAVTYFDTFLVKAAKKCSVETSIINEQFHAIISFLNNLSDDIFANYTIIIHDQYEVLLYPHASTEYYIVCVLETVVNSELIHEAIKQIPFLKQTYPMQFKKNKSIEIDMRFNDQIVFTKNKKE